MGCQRLKRVNLMNVFFSTKNGNRGGLLLGVKLLFTKEDTDFDRRSSMNICNCVTTREDCSAMR